MGDMKLTPAQLDSYLNDGFLVIENLIPMATLRRLSDRINAIQGEMASMSAGRNVTKFQMESDLDRELSRSPALRKLTGLAATEPAFYDAVSTPTVLDAVSQLTGGGREIMGHSDQVFMKPAFCGSAKPLHQDNSYFKIAPHSAGLTCWMAVDDATVENGCMHYIRGSHRLGMIKHKALSETHLTPDVNFALNEPEPVPIPAGSCIFHHLLVLHSSPANTSAKPRRAYAMHYANRSRAEVCNKSWQEMLVLR
jgi:ectoine hydroxylase-related dioxygenase (phytanoyl-CoA dioxygenase family)